MALVQILANAFPDVIRAYTGVDKESIVKNPAILARILYLCYNTNC